MKTIIWKYVKYLCVLPLTLVSTATFAQTSEIEKDKLIEKVVQFFNDGQEAIKNEDDIGAKICYREALKALFAYNNLTQGGEKYDAEEYIVSNIMAYYIQKRMIDEALTQINSLLTSNEIPYHLYVKGILLFEKKQYDDAVSTLKKIVDKNERLVAEANSQIGHCYFFPGQDFIKENEKLTAEDPRYAANEAQVKELYNKAKPYYEEARKKAPENKSLWGYYLLNIYWVLKMVPEYEVLAKELGVE